MPATILEINLKQNSNFKTMFLCTQNKLNIQQLRFECAPYHILLIRSFACTLEMLWASLASLSGIWFVLLLSIVRVGILRCKLLNSSYLFCKERKRQDRLQSELATELSNKDFILQDLMSKHSQLEQRFKQINSQDTDIRIKNAKLEKVCSSQMRE